MSTGLIIAIVVVVLILIALLAVLPKMRREAAEKKRQREIEQRRTQAADQQRTQAEAQRHEAEAAEHRAQAQRAEADVAEKRAAASRAEAEAREAKAHATEQGHADHELGIAPDSRPGDYAEGRAERTEDPLAARRADAGSEQVPATGRSHEPDGSVRERGLRERADRDGDGRLDAGDVQPKPRRDDQQRF